MVRPVKVGTYKRFRNEARKLSTRQLVQELRFQRFLVAQKFDVESEDRVRFEAFRDEALYRAVEAL